MGKCLNCGKELICDQIEFLELSDGKKVRFIKSAPHGCPPEYDHSIVTAKELGCEDDCKELFNRLRKWSDLL